jgi:hypothetical protein
VNSNKNNELKLFSVPSEKLVLLSVCTYSLYSWYWLFKNWSGVCNIRKKSYSPIIGAWLWIFYNHHLFEEIKTLAEEKGIPVSWTSLNIYGLFLLFFLVWYIPYMMFVSIFVGIALLPINNTCAQFNEANGFEESAQEGFDKKDWVILFIGGTLVIMSLLKAILLSGVLSFFIE